MPNPMQGIHEFRQRHDGDIITPDDDRYEQARRVWNAMIDRRPALIARPRHIADVQASLAFAREHQLPLAVRGGAHGIGGRSTCDEGIVIDFADMQRMAVDAGARTATAEPGVRWRDFDRETQAHGLATTGGTDGDTGVAGLTLGGGFGWLEGRCGLTVDNLLSVEVVLASGEVVRASQDEHQDLFWALRGGGGNFGIVTSFAYRLHEIGPVIGGLVVHPFARAAEMLRFYNDFLKRAPAELVAAAVLMTGPDGNKACGMAVTWPGDLAEGERVLAPLKSFGPPVLDVIGPMPYVQQQALLKDAMPPNVLNYWKAEFIDQLSDDVNDAVIDAFTRVQSPMASVVWFPIRGAAARVAPTATAFPHRGGFNLGIYGVWKDAADTPRNISWVRDTWAAITPFATGGVYVNEIGDDDGADRVRSAYGPNFDRLTQVKGKYDPGNVFCLNANIAPAMAAG